VTVKSQRLVLVGAHHTYDEALDDLLAYREMYPQRSFEIELCEDGRDRPWRVMVRIGPMRPWMRWPFSSERRRLHQGRAS
jgi:antibiotic biosynthesis monooxygenase (ABM) superfamily enzyme